MVHLPPYTLLPKACPFSSLCFCLVPLSCHVGGCTCRHGFQLVVAVALGSVELMVVALTITNLHRDRAYPTFWF